jgi:branched-chain amino acid transport system substrate-binding protein
MGVHGMGKVIASRLRLAPASRLRLAPIGLGTLLALLPACSLIVDRNADQCNTDSDCAAIPGTRCVANACEKGECQTNQDCVQQHGAYHICRKTDLKCGALLSAECQTIDGDGYVDDSAFIIGSIGPTGGADSSTGLSELNGATLAASDFMGATNGLPPRPGASTPRPIVVVSCDDMSASNLALNAANHLVKDVGVQAIIGAAWSGVTIDVATQVTIPNNVLLISPSATSIAITTLKDNGLLWRTSPSDVYQAAAMASYSPIVEAKVRAVLKLPQQQDIIYAVYHKGDAYGTAIAEALTGQLMVNGKSVLDPTATSFFNQVDYGDPNNPGATGLRYDQAYNDALARLPHIIVLLGTAEAITEVLRVIERQWPASAPYRPWYLGGDGEVQAALWNEIASNDNLRQRVTGTVPGTTSPLFEAFANHYTSVFNGSDGSNPNILGAAGAFDSVYLLSYAATAIAPAGLSETGPNLVQGLKRLVTGPAVEARQSDINIAFQALQAPNGSIDFAGASGPLDFDLDIEEAPGDIQIWCVPSDAKGVATPAVFSGIYLDATSKSLMGADYATACKFDPCHGQCATGQACNNGSCAP